MASIDYTVRVGRPLSGSITVAGDKSISHRAVILGALAEGRSEVTGLLEGEDVLGTVAAFRALGVAIEGPHDGRLTIDGVGLHGLKAPAGVLDLGNSGTSMRLLAGLLAAQPFTTRLVGDESLMRRPMERVAVPLRSMGAVIETGAGGRPPLHIAGGRTLHAIEYRMPVASAQVKSAILLAALYAQGRTVVVEPAPSRDHTERMLAGFGYPVTRDGASVALEGGGGPLHAVHLDVPADLSSAAFFLVAASIVPGSCVRLRRVGMNPTRRGAIDILRAMGAHIEAHNEAVASGEPVADLVVRSAPLRGIAIPRELVPLAIDEFPALFIAAACAQGTTVLHGAEELRVKESDRLAVMAQGLARLGVTVEEYPDGLAITGAPIQGGVIDSGGDHRVAMAFAVAGLRAAGAIEVRDCRNVATSFPGFVACARAVGFDLEVRS
ncbi:3-phosphoshikimate 1-carboxyvinyltransferase [Acidiferrobacter sp.]|uniref:3-phosphoshikimate 1-carboxyvinyltransferase n=1 Tax=Acidiferrobacter sp. TaxID=1872107 RepID=UPI00261EB29B|nr:3-phosphoshikimate 1-carboxyvinyltransferase [Acidiferrobacter sp.]